MPISEPSKNYTQSAPRWRTMRAVIGGQDVIKGKYGDYKPTEFLPSFVPHDKARYEAYLKRALFVEFTKSTLDGLTGAVFRKAPSASEIPPELEYVRDDIDGEGNGIENFSKTLVTETLTVARVGILTEMPVRPEGYTGELQPYAKVYDTESILDVRVAKSDDGKKRINHVRLIEDREEPVDRFTVETVRYYRLLELDEAGWYYQQLFNEEGEPVSDPIYPRDVDGELLTEIPIVIIGADSNDSVKIDKPPLLGIAWVNLGHYQNSADYEENMHVHGQGTMFISSELSVDQFKEANPDGVKVGARAGHFIGPDGNVWLLQAEAASALLAAMDNKVDLMIGLGARFVQNKSSGSDPTATEIVYNASKESSNLSTLVGNVSDGLTATLRHMMTFTGGNVDDVDYRLNMDFFDRKLTAQDISAILLLSDAGRFAPSDIHRSIQRAGMMPGSRTVEEVDAEVRQDGV